MTDLPIRRATFAAVSAAHLCWSATADAADTWPDLMAQPKGGPSRDRAKDAALVIAIGDYDHAQDLPGAVANGRAWASYLKDVRGVPTVKVLEDATATREEILLAAKGIASRASAGGRLWIVYIGHGAPAADGSAGMLVGVDARQTATSLAARSVRLDELEAAVTGPAAEVVLIQDACFSGKTDGSDLAPGLAPMVAVSERLGPKWTVLSAGQNDEYAGPLPDGSRPAFSYLVLGALRGWGDANKDGKVTAAEVTDYANSTIFQTVTGRTQRPQRVGPNLVLSKSTGESGPDLGKLVLISAQTQRIAAAEAELRSAAARDFTAIASAVQQPTPASRKALELYLGRYRNAAVSVDGDTTGVSLDEVGQVELALARLDGMESGRTGESRPKRSAAIGYASAGLLGAGGAALLVSSAIMQSSTESDAKNGKLTYNEAITEANAANRLAYLGYGSLGLGTFVGLSTGFWWTSGEATPAVSIGLRGGW